MDMETAITFEAEQPAAAPISSLEARKIELVSGLRALADFINEHSMEQLGLSQYSTIVFTGYPSKEQLAETIRGSGHWDKKPHSETMDFRKELSPAVKLDLSIPRDQVCVRVVTGKKVVPERYVPGYVENAHEEEVVEWRCGSVLADTPAQTPSAADLVDAALASLATE